MKYEYKDNTATESSYCCICRFDFRSEEKPGFFSRFKRGAKKGEEAERQERAGRPVDPASFPEVKSRRSTLPPLNPTKDPAQDSVKDTGKGAWDWSVSEEPTLANTMDPMYRRPLGASANLDPVELRDTIPTQTIKRFTEQYQRRMKQTIQ